MSFSPVPKYSFKKVTDISPDFLSQIGVSMLMLDLDNTVALYGDGKPSDKVRRWAADMQRNSITLFFVSNSRRKGRVETFSETLGIGFIKAARKPSPAGVFKALENTGHNNKSAALAGDQIFTDTIAANSAGVVSIVVLPLGFNLFFAIRYILELPFRAACKNKMGTSI